MSLLDYRHLGAPFRNGIHLVAIIFIVALFALYRFSTGGFDSGDDYSYPAQKAPQQDPKLPLPQGRRDGPFPGFGNLQPNPAQTQQQKNEQAAPPKDLNDIEQALGMHNG